MTAVTTELQMAAWKVVILAEWMVGRTVGQ